MCREITTARTAVAVRPRRRGT